uniref:Uncharacterized protein LOC109506674 n=1 Tax=Elaeis guineensis var. tenera TaxID=51953 RepID=A0A8N4IC06_ELAGV|nr:uncharacterized protein LOC109506674 [Elaeis guineensis]
MVVSLFLRSLGPSNKVEIVEQEGFECVPSSHRGRVSGLVIHKRKSSNKTSPRRRSKDGLGPSPAFKTPSKPRPTQVVTKNAFAGLDSSKVQYLKIYGPSLDILPLFILLMPVGSPEEAPKGTPKMQAVACRESKVVLEVPITSTLPATFEPPLEASVDVARPSLPSSFGGPNFIKRVRLVHQKLSIFQPEWLITMGKSMLNT